MCSGQRRDLDTRSSALLHSVLPQHRFDAQYETERSRAESLVRRRQRVFCGVAVVSEVVDDADKAAESIV